MAKTRGYSNLALLREQIASTAEIFCKQEGLEYVDVRVKIEQPEGKSRRVVGIEIVERDIDPTDSPCWGDN